MAVVKKSVAFDEAVCRQALELAGERGFSRFVNDAVAQRLQALRIEAWAASIDQEVGAVPDDTVAFVRLELDAALQPA